MAKDPGKGSGSVSKEDVTIASQLAGLISQMAMQSSRLAASFETQAEATAKMAENMKNMGTGDVVNQLVQVNVTLKEVAAALQNLNTTSAATFEAISNGAILAAGSTKQLSDAAKEATVAADRQKTSFEDLKERLAETGANALTGRQKMRAFGDYLEKEFPVAIGAALGALSGLKQGFRNIISLGKGIFGFGMTVGKALFGIGKSILSIPFKLLSGLTDMASSGGGISEYAQAINNLRKEFGALSGPVASTIISTAKEMKGFSVQGLSANQAFGNVAERMEQLIKLFSAGGPALQKLSAEFKDNGGAILGFQKGLGLSDEQMGSLAERVNIAGGTISDSLLDMTKQATHLGKEFGVDFKIISKGMAKATADFKSFGSMSQKQIGVAVTYFAKLGVQLDKVTGVMDSFNTFDDAAEKVSTLNQVFGVNVDAMKMMNAENPAERVSMLQKEFAKAGISGEKLTRAQRQLIAQNTGIEESALAQALSSKNQSVSLDKITKAGDKAAKSEMNQAQALNKLADAMDRVLKSGDQKSGGFFDNFSKGFTDGIASTKEFREIMLNLRGALRVVYLEGVRLGKAFVEHFPGMKDFLGGLADLLKPEKFKKLASGVTDVFIGFFKDLESGKASFPDLMERLKKTFFDFFDSEKGAGQKTLGGFKKIMMAIQVILAGGVKWILETMAGFIKNIVDFIKNPEGVPGVGKIGDAATAYVSPIAQAFRDGMKVLGPPLKELLGLMFDKLLEILKEKIDAHKGEIALIMFGPVLQRALMGAAAALAAKAGGALVAKLFGGSVQDQMLDQMKKLNEKMAAGAVPPSGPSPIPNISPKDTKKLKEMESKFNWTKIGQFLVGLAGVMVIGIAAFLLAVLAIRAFKITPIEIALAGAIILSTAITALAVGGTLKLLETMPKPKPTFVKDLLLVGAAMVGLAVLGGAIAYGVKEAGIGIGDVVTGTALVLATALAAVATIGVMALVAVAAAAMSGPQAALLVVGLPLVALVMIAMANLGLDMVNAVRNANINAKDVELAGSVISLTAKAIGVTVLAMAAAMGATVFAAISGLMKYFTGADPLEILGTMITSVTQVGLTIVEALKDVPRDIGPVVDAFVKILDSVATIMKVIPDTLKAMDFGFFESSEDQTNKINAVTGMIANLIGRDAGGEKIGIVGLMSTIIDGVKNMDASNIEAAKAIAPVFQAVGSIMQAIGSTLAPITAIASAIDDDDFEKLPAIIKQMGDFMSEVGKPITSIIKALKPLIVTATSMSKTDAQSIQALAGLFQAIGPIAQAMQLPPGMADVLKAATETTFGENAGDILGSLGKYMNSVGAAMSVHVIPAIKDAVIGMITSLSTIGQIEPSQVEVLKAVGPLLSTMVNFATSMAKPALEAKTAEDALKKSDVVTTVLKNMGEHLPKIFSALSENIGKLIDGVINVLKTVKIDASTKGKIEYLNLVFGVIDSLTKVAGMVRDPYEWENNMSASDGLVKGIARVAIFLGRLTGPGNAAFEAGKAPLDLLMENLENLTKGLGDTSKVAKGAKDLGTLLDGVSKVVTVVSNMSGTELVKLDEKELKKTVEKTITSATTIFAAFDPKTELGKGLQEKISAVKAIPEATIKTVTNSFQNLESVVDGYSKFSGSIKKIALDGIQPNIEGMQKIIGAIAQIDKILTGTDKTINISTALQRFKANFGGAMGQKGSHVVQAKDVTINVNFVVAIDATKLEGAILANSNSKIKEKINLVIGAIGQIPGKEIGFTTPENGPPNMPFAMIKNGKEGLP